MTSSRTLRPRAAACCAHLGRQRLLEARHHARDEVARRSCAAAACRYRERGSPRDRAPADRARGSARACDAAAMNSSAEPKPRSSKIAAICRIVRPSRNVTGRRNTSPRTILSTTARGVIGASKRYSPACRRRPAPSSQTAIRNASAPVDDAGIGERSPHRLRAAAGRDLDERLRFRVALVRARHQPVAPQADRERGHDDERDQRRQARGRGCASRAHVLSRDRRRPAVRRARRGSPAGSRRPTRRRAAACGRASS